MKALFSWRPSPTLVVACIALAVALGPTAYALAPTITGADIVDESLSGVDVRGRPGTATTPAVNGSLNGNDISGQAANPANGTPFINGSLSGWDIGDGSLLQRDLADAAVTNSKLAPNSVASGKVLDGSLTSADLKDAASGSDDVNADMLDGKDSTQLSPASGDGRTADLVLDSPQDQTVLTANITTSGPSALLASAALQVNGDGGNDDGVSCVLRFDGTSESVRHATVIPDAFYDWSSLAVVWAHVVGPGAHTVELRCFRFIGSVTVDDAALIVSAHPVA